MKHPLAFIVAVGCATALAACLATSDSTENFGSAAPLSAAAAPMTSAAAPMAVTIAPLMGIEAAAAPAQELSSPLQAPCLDYWPEGAPRAVGENFWPKRRLKVEFMGGSEALRERVMAQAKTWSQHAHVTFDFGQFLDSDIRVSFNPRLGHWSTVGTDAEEVAETKPTMNLALADHHAEEDLRRVVLHEFGHALGLMHEHQAPAANPIQWNEPAVIAYYSAPPNKWDEAMIRHNILNRYQTSQRATDFDTSAFDRNSIMLYPVLAELTTNGYEVGWNKSLSANDKAFIAKKYP